MQRFKRRTMNEGEARSDNLSKYLKFMYSSLHSKPGKAKAGWCNTSCFFQSLWKLLHWAEMQQSRCNSNVDERISAN